jgi:hypothetical protein
VRSRLRESRRVTGRRRLARRLLTESFNDGGVACAGWARAVVALIGIIGGTPPAFVVVDFAAGRHCMPRSCPNDCGRLRDAKRGTQLAPSKGHEGFAYWLIDSSFVACV